MSQNETPKTNLDRAVDALRREEPDPATLDAARDRVLAALRAQISGAVEPAEIARIEGCVDFQSLLPAYLSGKLSPSRRLLLEDHTRSCLTCRRALKAARSGVPAVAPGAAPAAEPARTRFSPVWAIAAAVVLAAGVAAWAVWQRASSGDLAQIESIDGTLMSVAPQPASVQAGASLAARHGIRTAKGGRARIRLADGTRIEMAERSELSLEKDLDGVNVKLARGQVIVEAAKQKSGHLYVTTPDCRVSVVGTVFAVNHGIKGSRVSVLEGEVHVAGGSATPVLHRGDQTATTDRVERVRLEDEVAWSQDAAKHLALLGELHELKKAIDAALPSGVRTSSRLLDRVPAGTVLYVAVPNLAASAAEVSRILDERLAASPVMAAWWSEVESKGHGASFREAMSKVQAFGDQIGDELVLGVVMGSGPDQTGSPFFLAEAKRPADLAAFVDGELSRLGAKPATASAGGPKREMKVRMVTDAEAATAGHGDLLVHVANGLLVASTDGAVLRAAVEGAGDPGSPDGRASRFVGTPFHRQLEQAYRDGVETLFGLDGRSLVAWAERKQADHPERLESWRRLGLLDVDTVIGVRRTENGQADSRLALSFHEERKGLASWLAAPAPMGSLDFVSGEATLAAAFAVKEPARLLDDVFSAIEASQPDFREKLATFEGEQGLDVRRDLAEPLGGEITFALDGPVLPSPSWKVVVEVYDVERLMSTVGKLVERLDRQARAAGKPGWSLTRATSDGRTVYGIGLQGKDPLVVATFVDGYLIAAPKAALLDRAIQIRAAGASLKGAPKFTALLPRDTQLNFSAIVFSDFGSIVGPFASQLAAVQGSLSEKQKATVAAIAEQAQASLGYAYGEKDRIVIASHGPSGLFGIDLSTLVAATGLARPHGAPHTR